MSTVIVDEVKSIPDLMELIKKFLSEKNYPNDYKYKVKGQSVEFLFATMDIAYDFIKFFNIEKFKNEVYKKSTARMVMQTKVPKHKFDPENVKLTTKLNVD